ncbi:MAG: hypothetical protein GXP08_18030 [Gammaproteobacteria bacterium]|nr:hypothetical protein [Gammaproteobacteria bacterium]
MSISTLLLSATFLPITVSITALLQSASMFCFTRQFVVIFSTFLLLTPLLTACGDAASPNTLTPKTIPQSITVNPGTRVIELAWEGVSGASGYTVYWSNQANVSTTNGMAISTDEPHLIHSKLANNITYYYVVTSHTRRGESAESIKVSATPRVALPVKPDQVLLQAGDQRVTLRWKSVLGANSYTLFWSDQAGVTDGDNRIDNVVAPFVHSGLENGKAYYYVLVAQNEAGASTVSPESSATPQMPVPQSPVITQATPGSGKVTLVWDEVSNGTHYDLFWNTRGDVSESDAFVNRVTSPYTHAPLTDGGTYYYRLRSRNVAGVSPLSNTAEVQPPDTINITTPGAAPASPTKVTVSLQSGQLTINWAPVDEAISYNLYWRRGESGGVSRADNRIANIQAPYSHIRLNNGVNYYYRVSAVNDQGESTLSSEVQGIPQVIVPGVPAGLRALSGDEWIAVRWNVVEGATSYNLYINDQVIANVSSPYRINNLTNGTVYSIELQAQSAKGLSDRSDGIKAIPQEPAPNAPRQVAAIPGNGRVTVQWHAANPQNPSDADEAITAYYVYYHSRSGVNPTNGTLISDAGITQDAEGRWQLQHTAIQNGQRYYYVVTAKNAGGESRASREVWAYPQVPVPNAPSGLWVEAGDNQAIIHFTEAKGAINPVYNLYWRKRLDDGTRSDPFVISNIKPDFKFSDGEHTNGNTYYFQVSAFNDSGESELSAQASASPQIPPPERSPGNARALAQDGHVILIWQTVTNASAYAIYWSTEPTLDPRVSTRISSAATQPGYRHEQLHNGQVYYYQVAAVNAGGEGPLSEMLIAKPQVNPPTMPSEFSVIPGNGEVIVNWRENPAASSHILYWSIDEDSPFEQWARLSGLQSGDTVSGLSNGQRYYYQLVAVNPGGLSDPTEIVSAIPEAPAPASPSGLSAAAGDGQVSLNWHSEPNLSYALHWSDKPDISPIDSGNHIANVKAAYVHTSLSNGTTYRYQLTATNSGGESLATVAVIATPQAAVSTAPRALSAEGGDQQITLRWFPAKGAPANVQYTLYWNNVPEQGINGTAISHVTSPYVHTGLSNGQAYYYVITATDTVESPASNQAMAQPLGALPATPASVWVIAGDTQNTLHWQGIANATRYGIHWSPQADLSRDVSRVNVNAPVTQYEHVNLNNNQILYYRVTAHNDNGDSQPSKIVSATPQRTGNQAPQIQQGALINIAMDEDSTPIPFELTLNATDTDGDNLSWSLAADARQGTAIVISNGDSAMVSYDPVPNYNGNDRFQLRVNDDQGGSDSITVNVIIASQNDAPNFITVPSDQTHTEEESISVVTASAIDTADGDTLIYTASGLPPGINIDPNSGQISGTINGGANNSPYTVTLTADDQSGAANAKTSTTFQWTINPAFYTIGGTLSGLISQGLVLQLNGSNDLVLSNNGSFAFNTLLANGSAYTVTIASQPNSQLCHISNGAETVSRANVINVSVSCDPLLAPSAKISFPTPSALTDASTLTITGTASDTDPIVAVRVNGLLAETNNGFNTWRIVVPIELGTTTITVATEDLAGNVNNNAAQTTVINKGVLLESPQGIALDSNNNRALVTDTKSGALLAVDLDTGFRTVLSDAATGSGPVFSRPIDIALDSNNNRVLVINSSTTILSVDLPTGNRIVLSDPNSGSGPVFGSLRNIALDAANNRALVTDQSLKAVVSVDLSSGDRLVLSDAATGSGAQFEFPNSIVLDIANNRALVVDGTPLGVLLAVNLSNGDRTVLSGRGIGIGPALGNVSGIVLDRANNRALISDISQDALLAVDLASGHRTVISNAKTGTGPELVNTRGLALDSANNRVIVTVTDGAPIRTGGVLMAVDLASGNRSRLSDNRMGAGPLALGDEFGDIVLDSANNRALVTDGRAVLTVDLATGNRRVLSDATTGSGPGFNFVTVMVLDSTNNRVLVATDTNLIAVDLVSGSRTVVGAGSDRIIGMALDKTNNRVLVTIAGTLNLEGIDLTSGESTLLSGNAIGTGPETLSYDLALDSANNRVLLAAPGGILAVDLTTGNRTMLSDATTGTGPPLVTILTGIVLDSVNNRVLVTNLFNSLFAVDLVSGDRTLLSSPVDVVPLFYQYVDITLDEANNLSLQLNRSIVSATELGSGDRVIVSW